MGTPLTSSKTRGEEQALAVETAATKCTKSAYADSPLEETEHAQAIQPALLALCVGNVTHEVAPGEFFKWQGSYGAFTVSKEAVPSVKAYIERQKEHHGSGDVVTEWERTTAEVKGHL